MFYRLAPQHVNCKNVKMVLWIHAASCNACFEHPCFKCPYGKDFASAFLQNQRRVFLSDILTRWGRNMTPPCDKTLFMGHLKSECSKHAWLADTTCSATSCWYVTMESISITVTGHFQWPGSPITVRHSTLLLMTIMTAHKLNSKYN